MAPRFLPVETMVGTCSVCDAPGLVEVIAGDGKTANDYLCARCDARGRLASAKLAYQVAIHRAAVSRGYNRGANGQASAGDVAPRSDFLERARVASDELLFGAHDS